MRLALGEGCGSVGGNGLSHTNNMVNLTKQQQFVLVMVILLFLGGWAVKAWRTAHPSGQPVRPMAR